MPCCIGVEMAGSASRANMMNMFTDEEKQQVSGGRRSDNWPNAAVTQTFRQNCEQRYTQQRSCGETNQCAKRLVLQMQRGADSSTGKGENVSGGDLPECVDHSGACRCVVFAAMLRLNGDVNQF